MTHFVQIVTTTEKREDAERIAAALVDERLAACAQIVGPIRSTYHWQGKVESAEEWQCLLKSRRAQFAAVETAIRGLHPYDEPEILAFDIVAGSAGYLAWMDRELDGGEDESSP